MTEKPEPRYQVTVERTSAGTFVARNRRGGEIRFSTGEDGGFSPVDGWDGVSGCRGEAARSSRPSKAGA